MSRLDINKDGYISREDFDLMGKKLVEHSGMTEKQAEATKKAFLKVADMSLEDAAKQGNESLLSMSPAERKAIVDGTHNFLFDAIDTNKDGHISVEEFKVYLNIIAPGIAEDEITHSFRTIDADKNGEISCEEFMAAAYDFLLEVEETELSKVFMGPLLD